MEQQLNVFHKGIVSDLDPTKTSPDQWAFPTLNLRIFNKDGQGLVATNVLGNEYIFTLPTGMKVVGAKDYKGVVYIVSANTSGFVQIGTYPSPKGNDLAGNYAQTKTVQDWIDSGNTNGFDYVYRSLANFTVNPSPYNSPLNIIRDNFYTDVMNIFNEDGTLRYVEVNLYEKYDETVDLFLCDGINVNKVINNGFKVDGTPVARFYNKASFPNIVSQVPALNKRMNVDFSVTMGGQWKTGNTFIYIRYLTEDFVRTEFVYQSDPIMIVSGGWSGSAANVDYNKVHGISGNPTEDGKNDKSKKSITLNISNLDRHYKYYEIAFSRHYSDELQQVVVETALIDNYFPIEADTAQTILTGFEGLIDIGVGEIQESYSPDDISLTQEIDNARYMGGNWKSTIKHDDILSTMIGKITMKYDTIELNKTQHYKRTLNVEKYTGFFRSEPYPFGVVCEFYNGRDSAVYLPTGLDDLNGAGTVTNNKGLYRFPLLEHVPHFNNATEYIVALGIKFDLSDMIAYINSDPDIKQYIEDNIKSIYFVRGPRTENLRYQGITINACRSYRVANFLTDAALREQETIVPILPARATDLNTTDTSWTATSGGSMAKEFGQNHTKATEYDQWGGYYGITGEDPESLTGTDKGPHIGFYAKDLYTQMPIYKGFIPSQYAIFRGNEERTRFRNYMGLSYFVPGKYGVFSTDYILENNNPDLNEMYCYFPYIIRFAETVDSEYKVYPRILKAEHNSIYNDGVYGTKSAYMITSQVKKYTQIIDSVDGFVSEYTDAGVERNNIAKEGSCMTYASKKNGKTFQGWQNRSMSTAKYIGLATKDGQHISYLAHTLCCLYNVNPTDLTLANIIDPQTTTYSRLSENLAMDQIINGSTTEHVSFGGDCFINLTHFKQMSYNGTTLFNNETIQYDASQEYIPLSGQIFNGAEIDVWENDEAIDYGTRPNVFFGHGLVMGIITENKINTAGRYPYAKRTFYPYTNNLYEFGVFSSDTEVNTESLLCQFGNSITSNIKLNLAHNPNIPDTSTKRKVRVRFSDKQESGEFVNGLRYLRAGSYRDYDVNDGEIISLRSILGHLTMFQTDAISELYTDRKQAVTPQTEGELATGIALPLSPRARKMSNYGLQHRQGIIVGEGGAYHVDLKRRAIIKTSITSTDSGAFYLSAQNILKGSFNENWVEDWINQFDDLHDIKSWIEDDPFTGYGVVVGYDSDYNEVLFTFLNKTGRGDRIVYTRNTLVYSELNSGFFTGEYSFTPYFYMNNGKDLYTPYNYSSSVGNNIYRHNAEGVYHNFYGEQYDFILSWIVNGLNEQRNTSAFTKQYLSHTIEGSPDEFSNILWKTQFQESDTVFIDPDKFWQNPEYIEHKWNVPIFVQTSADDNEWETDSFMNGTYLKTTLTFSENTPIVIRKIITNFILSQA